MTVWEIGFAALSPCRALLKGFNTATHRQPLANRGPARRLAPRTARGALEGTGYDVVVGRCHRYTVAVRPPGLAVAAGGYRDSIVEGRGSASRGSKRPLRIGCPLRPP